MAYMNDASEREVRPDSHGGWEVHGAPDGQSRSRHETEAQARAWARHVVRQNGGGKVKVYDLDGRERDSEDV